MKKTIVITILFVFILSCSKQNKMIEDSSTGNKVDTEIIMSNDVPANPVYMEDGIDLKNKKLVPDKETAFNIAIAVLSNIYDKEVLQSESPFNVYLKDSVWVVYGTQKHQKGGFSYIEINSTDGRVLKVSHEE